MTFHAKYSVFLEIHVNLLIYFWSGPHDIHKKKKPKKTCGAEMHKIAFYYCLLSDNESKTNQSWPSVSSCG